MIKLLTLILILLIPSIAFADLYKYRGKDGELIISSTPRKGLKLIEVTKTRSAKKKSKTQMKTALQKPEGRTAIPSYRKGKKKHDRFDATIREASKKYNVPFAFVKAVIRIESAFNPTALSHAGAMGLMQLMPRTAASMGVKDPYSPRQNIFGGTKFLRVLTDRYDGDINLILAAYNAGDGAVARYKGIPYPQTRGYVSSVFRWYRKYSEE